MQKQLEEICTKALKEVENAATGADIDNIKLEYLSRKSVLNNIKNSVFFLSTIGAVVTAILLKPLSPATEMIFSKTS